MSLFQHTVLKKQIAAHSEKIRDAYKRYAAYFLNPVIQENIRNSKEEQFQESFLRELFVKILGYTLNPDPNYNLITEKKNEIDSKKADGAILNNGEVKAVIELKDHKTTDLKQVESQAFGYKNNHRKTSYVIISNFEKLRFYIENTIDCEEFNLFALSEEDFAVLWICLAYENIAKDLPKQLKSESTNNEEQITKQLYKDYSAFKRELYADFTFKNPDIDKLTLFKKTQKLLDRLLFIFFAEDCNLLPPNSMSEIIIQWEKLKEMDEYKPLYDRIKKYFGYMNTGFKGKKYDVFAYNGGLFKPDEVLDSVVVSDEVLRKHSLKLSQYDFASEVDVNILGHIFENSLTEIEEITNEITRGHAPLPTSKRKKDGVFYTPRYITSYIVENTLGKLCMDRKTELEIDESEYFSDKKRQIATKKKLDEKLKSYRQWLLGLTICDPACGSGAFLNAALDFLIAEHKLIDEMSTKLSGGSIVFSDIENAILENNLYGVDINEESVEIARLALWLRTAKPQRKLNSLNNNIKCGNSLIMPPATNKGACPLAATTTGNGACPIAGSSGGSGGATIEKAFDWYREFPQVFKEKNKQAFHVTWVAYNSRISQRVIDYRIKTNTESVYLSEKEEIIVTQAVAEIIKKDNLNCLAYNICGDHVHLLLVCEEDELEGIVRKMKSVSARKCNVEMGRTLANSNKVELPAHGETQYQLWAQKFDKRHINNNEQLHNTIEYIQNNRQKHDLPTNKGASPLAHQMLCTIDHAFRSEYKGGFDVVIGNPPYGAKIDKQQIAYLSEKYAHWGISSSLNDTYFVFYAMALENILAPNGYLGFITPNTWKLIEGAKRFRKVLFDNFEISQIIQHLNKVFEDATVDCDSLIIRKSPPSTRGLAPLSPLVRGQAPLLVRFMNKSTLAKEHSLPQSLLAKQDYINLFLTQKDYDLKILLMR
jgi:REP element-mobilizing transposase RayT